MTEKQPCPGARSGAHGAGDRIVLGRACDPQNSNGSDRAQVLQRYDVVVDAALRGLCPDVTEAERQALRPTFKQWCAAARKYLTSPQAEEDDTDFALVWFDGYASVPPQYRRRYPQLVGSIMRELRKADAAVPKCCRWPYAHSLALMLERFGLRAEPHGGHRA